MTDDEIIEENENGSPDRGEKRPTQCSCQQLSCSRRRTSRESHRRRPSEIKLRILSASYGPCEYNDGECSDATSIPSTRDCSSFVLDLLIAARNKEQGRHQEQIIQKYREKSNNTIQLPSTVDGKIQSFIYLLPGMDCRDNISRLSSSESTTVEEFVSMNAVFGDPCPGKTKRLEVRYTVTEIFTDDSSSKALRPSVSPPTEIHRVSFAEHETVKLRRSLTTISTSFDGKGKLAEKDTEKDETAYDTETNFCSHCQKNTGDRLTWDLRAEIVLPILLPFLNLWERMQCRLICRGWMKIVQECGVSRSIDVNNTDLMMVNKKSTQPTTEKEKPGGNINSNSSNTNTANNNNNSIFTPHILRGLLAYSYSSLQSLFLSGFGELEKEDLHSALPHIKNLRVLDISHCLFLDDSTLKLLAQPDVPSSATLRVLYLKGLRKITDLGLEAVCSSCSQLEVLDLSHLTNITDAGGRYIQKLVFLRALFLRDNWQLTNGSLDAITTSCSKLEQLTLWGCVRFRHLKFDNDDGQNNSNIANTTTIRNRLVILNLWGCHDLEDDTADVLSTIPNLSSLIVSECHRLTDRFVKTFVEGTEQQHKQQCLQHLHLRYLKRITDASAVAIALHLRNLFSLDLSFCSKVTATGIYRLLDELRESLVELRLISCRSLQIGKPTLRDDRRRFLGQQNNNNNHNHAGNWVLNALRRRPHSTVNHSLCLLDVRGCGGQPALDLPYPEDDPFTKGMMALEFAQKVPGFFTRSAFG